MLSIVTPNLNNGKYLEDNILSIQKLKVPFEHIVVDGGSTDNSIEIVKKYPHVKLLHQTERTGMYGAIDQGFMNSKGDYLAWVNADDQILIEGYRAMYNEATMKKFDFIYSDGIYNFVHQQKSIFGKGRRFGKFFLKHGCIPSIQSSLIFSKKTYNIVGGFNFKRFRICGDLDLFVKIARNKDSKFKYLPVTSSVFMKRGDSLGDLNTERYFQELKDNELPRPSIFIRVLFFICKYV